MCKMQQFFYILISIYLVDFCYWNIFVDVCQVIDWEILLQLEKGTIFTDI